MRLGYGTLTNLGFLLAGILTITSCGGATGPRSSLVSTGTAGSTSGTTVTSSDSGTTTTTSSNSGSSSSGSSTTFQANLSAAGTWMRTGVSPDGAILYGSSKINPYYSNLAAIGLTHDPASYATVKAWMQWYIRHLNLPDQWGLNGSIYDYSYSNGIATSLNDADSTDSYAATFLTLAWAYYQTGDASAQSYVKSIASQLDTVGGAILGTQQSDGLTWAKPNYQIKYLMDNCEAYRGLRDLASLFTAIGNSEAAKYNSAADSMLAGINGMWMNGTWAVYKDGVGNLAAPKMGTWYPDATSQVFPVLEGVISASDAKSTQVYNNLNTAWPGWPTLSFNSQDTFPWVLVADAAVMMGDTTRVNTYLQSMTAKYVNKNFPWPWYSAENGWYMRLNAYILGARPL